MATKIDNKDDLHGEEQVKPLFGPGSDNESSGGGSSYDDQKTPLGDASNPAGSYAARQQSPAGDSSNPRGASGESSAPSRWNLGEQESTASSGAFGQFSSREQALNSRIAAAKEGRVGKGYSKEKSKSGGFGKLKGNLGKLSRKRIVTMAIIAAIGGGGIFGASNLSGPFQTIHLAQNLGKHFKSGEDHGNDRTSKVLIYALAGKGAQNGRLGVTGNFAANKWEKRLLDNSGMRPVYSDPGRRFVGFEIVDQNKANSTLGEAKDGDSRKSRKLQQNMGEGAERRKPKTDERFINSQGNAVKGEFVDLSRVGSGDRRVWIKTIGKTTGVNTISNSVGSRLLIKRGGISFHTLNKIKDKSDSRLSENRQEKREARREKAAEKRTKDVQNGVKVSDGPNAGSDKDEEGKDKPVEAGDQEISDESKKALNDFKGGVVKSGIGGAAAVGILCAAKAYGNGLEDFKYANNVLPMMRIGMDAVSKGSQAMSPVANDIDLEVLGDFNEYLYDEKTKTSWTNAESIRAEQGKEGGTPIAPEADLGKSTEKPRLFRMIDSIPVLGSACDALDTIAGLPVIKHLSAVVSSVTGTAIDTALIPFDTTSDELMQSSLKTLAGKTVDPLAEGAALGNFGNTGTFLAANDQAITTGGRPLTSGERTNLAMVEEADARRDRAAKPILARYFDPYDGNSVVGSVIDHSPTSSSQAASMLANSVSNVGSGLTGMASGFMPKAKAKGSFDYGVAKFGHSLTEQNNPDFENPYINATSTFKNSDGSTGPSIEDDLTRLNEEYGEPCFGMTVTAEDDGVHIKSADKSVNTFKVYDAEKREEKGYKKQCDASENTTDRFNHFRMYLSDAVTAVSLACYEGDEKACDEIGAGDGSGAASTDDSGPTEAVSATVDVSQLGKNSDKLSCADGTKDLGVVTTKYTGTIKKESGPLKIRLCQVTDIPGSGNNASGAQITGGATVDARVSGAWAALAKQAKADGAGLSASSSFRLADSCNGTGDGTACARPGQSFHQTGLAIDFADMGVKGSSTTDCSVRARADSSKGWKWLLKNSEEFGIKQYTYEAWHWDPSGLANRCGKNDG